MCACMHIDGNPCPFASGFVGLSVRTQLVLAVVLDVGSIGLRSYVWLLEIQKLKKEKPYECTLCEFMVVSCWGCCCVLVCVYLCSDSHVLIF